MRSGGQIPESLTFLSTLWGSNVVGGMVPYGLPDLSVSLTVPERLKLETQSS